MQFVILMYLERSIVKLGNVVAKVKISFGIICYLNHENGSSR